MNPIVEHDLVRLRRAASSLVASNCSDCCSSKLLKLAAQTTRGTLPAQNQVCRHAVASSEQPRYPAGRPTIGEVFCFDASLHFVALWATRRIDYGTKMSWAASSLRSSPHACITSCMNNENGFQRQTDKCRSHSRRV